MSKANEARLDDLFQKLSVDLQHSPKLETPAVQRMLTRMRKRASYIRPHLNREGFDKFVRINELVGLTSIELDKDLLSNASYFVSNVLWRFNSRLDPLNIQEDLDMGHFNDLWRFGPGASNEVKGTHCAEKIASKMTCTESAEPLVLNLRRSNYYFNAFDALNEDSGTTLVRGSKLTTVPKNEDSVRIIAIEPSGNMCLQLAAGTYLQEVLKSIGLDITNQQDKNKYLAFLGSIDNSLATIDLSSASDMFTPELIRLLFPKKWYDLFMKIRSDSTTIDGVEHKLNMISTMGNGFTFPLMTFCLVALIYGMRCRKNGPTLFVDWSRTAVFGDDIIIPSTEYDEFCTILQQAGLVVNHDKSFKDGPFRESCGGDYYEGVDITPFYARSLSRDSDIYVVINQLIGWTIKHNVLVHRTLSWLISLLREPFFVPEWSNPDQGILTAEVSRRYKFLQPLLPEAKLSNHFFAMPLAVGGFIRSDGPDYLFTPRQFQTRYVVRRGRLPKGFLSGFDPCKRTASDSAAVSALLFSFRL